MTKQEFLEQLGMLSEEAALHETSAKALTTHLMDPGVEMDRVTIVGLFGELCMSVQHLRLSFDLMAAFLGGG